VKLRGFRIELGEIEAALLDSSAVAAAVVVVVVRDDMGPARRLVAYVVPRGTTPAHRDLRDHLAQRLPDYMIPSTFVSLAALPTTSSGKCDRAALPRPSGNPRRSTVEGPAA
jgi:acyl-coenzyme A synthetase/AMP-(fatty) acid ligase